MSFYLNGKKLMSLGQGSSGNSPSNVYVCDFLENSVYAELSDEQITEFLTNVTDPTIISKFSSIANDDFNVLIVSYHYDQNDNTYFFMCYYHNYWYLISLDMNSKTMQTEEP